ncbi:EHD1 [Symbiodinium sp. CCMP2592]|nr:EHD1 [Symbiodinium sp. CCMP2592]
MNGQAQPGGMPWAGQGNFNAFPQAMMGIQPTAATSGGLPDGGCGMSFPAAMPGVQGMPGLTTGIPSELQQQMVMMQQLQHQQQLLQQQLQQQQQQQPPQQQAPPPTPGADKDQQEFTLVVDSLSSAERGYYSTLWGIACPSGETLAGKAAFDFLSKSQLPREILKRIWDISDRQKRGLGWEEFVVTMKLISAAQKKQLVSLDRVLQTTGSTSRDFPAFDGIDLPADSGDPAAQEPARGDVFAEFAALAPAAEGPVAGGASIAPVDAVQEPASQMQPSMGPGTAQPESQDEWASFDLPAQSGQPDASLPSAASGAATAATNHAAEEGEWASFDFPAQPSSASGGAAAPAKPSPSPQWDAVDELDESRHSAGPSAANDKWDAFSGAMEEPRGDAGSGQAGQSGSRPAESASNGEWASFDFPAQPSSASGGAAAPAKPSPSPQWDAFDELDESRHSAGPSAANDKWDAFSGAMEEPRGDAGSGQAGQSRPAESASNGEWASFDFPAPAASPSSPSDWPSDSAAQPSSSSRGGAPVSTPADAVAEMLDVDDFTLRAAPGPSALSFPRPPESLGRAFEAFGREEDLDASNDSEADSLVRSLCALGRFEEALRCKANGDVLKRLQQAEDKKKDAVAKDDFEGAIQIRTEIKELSNAVESDEVTEAWRRLVETGDGDKSLERAAEQLQERCQWMGDSVSSAALEVAVSNFRSACPEPRPNCLHVLPSLVRQQRRARQMCRAIEALTSQNVLDFLQATLVSIKALRDLLVECSTTMSQLADRDWSEEERECVQASDEMPEFLLGLSALRRLLWRLGLAAELFMSDSEVPAGSPDAKALQELQSDMASSLAAAKASWAKLESDVLGLRLKLEPWHEATCFEAGGSTADSNMDLLRTAPLCPFCLLPCVPLALEAEVSSLDPGAASVPWRGGHWHVQCANFWLRHGRTSEAFKASGMDDPFKAFAVAFSSPSRLSSLA